LAKLKVEFLKALAPITIPELTPGRNNKLEPINYVNISHIKLNINNYHEFMLDRSININVGDVILIGINFSNNTPINNYNYLYGIFKIHNIQRSFNSIDNNSITNYNTTLTAAPIEIDQLVSYRDLKRSIMLLNVMNIEK
jgi:hypothetical protein